MKHRLFCLFMVMLLVAPVSAHAAAPELFRLQIIADSDSAADQETKLNVRNCVLELTEDLFSGAQSAAEARQIAQDSLEMICQTAKAAAGGPVRAEVGVFEFPDRIYAGVRVPAGEYHALRITIGAGRGHNWWCVLYPSLCCVDESAVNGENGITFYSSTLAFLERLFGGEKR